MTKQTLLLLAILTFSQSAFAKLPVCEHEGKTINVGETITIRDPALEAAAIEYGKDNGKTQQQIDEYLQYSDWLVYVLECQLTYAVNEKPDTTVKADVLKITGAAFVPLSHQTEWIQRFKSVQTSL
ncbi:hypothetical protein [Alteromonas macleodii]|uniref:Uncharacterized protein n=1 Tax=Alteromonas macleodii TaxID=28108 RepID=A0AB36FT05_ALTMA|nr:hypothetical protein [Alteromonas macleodii]OES24688.1 hypothetical protein BFV93_4705 [Alteromonas macleodii]OES25791.1 hypothetical protein BFV94_4317 [Alteromonas macleodii]OES25872.1 hypothetical protein BFV95_4260 [Alteromonas macleodii]OES38972.1 hypothetical protein BFV96_4466 [Alteromonas macleodii]